MTQGSNHVADRDTDDDEDQGQDISDVHDPLKLEEPEEIHISLAGSLQI